MSKRIYSHEELVSKLESAQLEIKRLASRPDHTKIIKGLIKENNELREHLNGIVIQRDDLFKCLKFRMDNDNE